MSKVGYSIETEQVTVQNLIIFNEEENEKLLKVTLNDELFKIVVLKQWEKKKISLNSNMIDKVEISEIV
ncbi:hypothetical protein IW492_11655 [Enterococcus sp. BWB1-3]|uniref:hypothetical protein n=1 Tax=unclassified Enterococcus TaxID=2608891 RepID=UPI00192193C6|nr:MULTISPECIES: hypothetical protein [unclassified Enterococcus]MBL1229887.1 hypothetical protein [Enterococcus sp. BWB1-3]MCB5951403.1 hypothetical protein [Enterococcus sp. BWT-B8]MCB5954962.1 hypothetical protein [Enterococcus sp. CWB-B31]